MLEKILTPGIKILFARTIDEPKPETECIQLTIKFVIEG